jgi:hypothetical protein
VIASGCEGQGEWGDVDRREQTFSYKINTLWGCNVQHDL